MHVKPPILFYNFIPGFVAGYSSLTAQIADRKVADLIAVNSLAAHLMELWLEEKIGLLKSAEL